MATERTEAAVLDELAKHCVEPGFIHALAHLCLRDNVLKVEGELKPDQLESSYGAARLIRSEISILIALMARQPIDASDIDAERLQQLMSKTEALLEELHWAMTIPWREAVGDLANLPGIAPFASGLSMREPIFYVAESAYAFQYRDLARQKYAADDAWLLANKGFRIDEACTIAHAMTGLISMRQTIGYRAFADDPSLVLAGFVFKLEDVVDASGLPAATVQAVLEAFTLTDAAAMDAFSEVSAFNPVNATPLLSAGGGRWALFQPFSLFEAIYETPYFWMDAEKAYRAQAAKNRGDFTEIFAAERLAAVFGQARVHRNVEIYAGKGKRVGEIDVLVLFGDHAIVLQAKSKRLTIEARRGGDHALKADFRKAVQQAVDQAQACAEALLREDLTFVDGDGKPLVLSCALASIYPLCIVSDHYPALAFQARQFLETRSTPKVRAPLVTDIFTLDAMTEMLDRPLRLLHYLTLRDHFGHKLSMGHERALLGLHLQTNLWFKNAPDQIYLADEFSVELDVAMMVRRDGVPGDRTPAGILTRLQDTPVAKLLNQIEHGAEPGFVRLGLWLLRLGEESHIEVSNGLAKIVMQALPGGPPRDVTVGVLGPPSGLTIHSNGAPLNEALERLTGHCAIAKYRERAGEWHGLLLQPGTGRILAAVAAEFPWKHDSILDKAVDEIRAARRKVTPAPPRRTDVGRNMPCPCGSGRKFKKCCGNKA